MTSTSLGAGPAGRYLDEREALDPEARERELMARLPALIDRARTARGFATTWTGSTHRRSTRVRRSRRCR